MPPYPGGNGMEPNDIELEAGLAHEGSSIMIGFADPDCHFLAEPEERDAHQSNCHEEKKASAIHVLEPKEGASKAHAQQQGGAHSRGESQARRITQQAEPSAQSRYVRFEVGSRCIVIGDLVQMPDAIHNSIHAPQYNRYESSNRAKQKGRRRRLCYHLRKLNGIRRSEKVVHPKVLDWLP
jgi:hypothetical protein